MAVFLNSQLDYIFFLYGLAFILLGGVCFAMLGVPGRPRALNWLGSFAVIHGISEWLDLIALLVGDAPSFAVVRTALMAISFALLLEFARREAQDRQLYVPAWPLYTGAAVLIIAVASVADISSANAVARYTLGLTSAAATAWLCARRGREARPQIGRLWMLAAAGFGIYAVAAGLIVPSAHFFPANLINHSSFARLTGMPIQLLRGLLACFITGVLWVIWKRMVAEDINSAVYTRAQQNLLVWTLVITASIIGLGWTLTEFLGGVYQRNVEEGSDGDIGLLAHLLDRETSMLGAKARAVAQLQPVQPLLSAAAAHEAERARAAFDLEAAASGATSAFVLDKSGALVASSGDGAGSHRMLPHFNLRDEHQGYALDPASGSPEYLASSPVRNSDGVVIGAVVLVRSLEAFTEELSGFNRWYFLVDGEGVVLATNRSEYEHMPLWPTVAARASADRPLMEQEILDGSWITLQGQRHYVRREFADQSRWSLVLVMPDSRVYASRFLGIIITLLVSIMVMIYFYGRERLIRDHIELESRLNLRDVAQNLRLQATTDALTGLFNRLKFNETLGSEMARCKRQHTPLSLMLFDVDRFKAINDGHGHQVGDTVLVRLSQFVRQRIRPSDLLARWGGEEFAILSPGSDGPMASQAADRLRTAIQEITFAKVGTLTCSFGVAQYVEGDTAESLLARADEALYRAKIGGRDRVELAA
ncbi:MAG TPA: sensor domain-containing diguanylate cyclase [Steroidobacteraceae bacterium]|jgi:diguanylate cyclase (GGDEF)-like protein